jgi:hypothetical protein
MFEMMGYNRMMMMMMMMMMMIGLLEQEIIT